jgi:biopolymer transport protein ExbB
MKARAWLGVVAVVLLMNGAPRVAQAQAGKGGAGAAKAAAKLEAPSEPFSVKLAWTTLKNRFEAGGGTMWAILFASTIGLASLLERMFRLKRRLFVPDGMADTANQLWKEGKFDEIEELCHRHRKSTLSKIILFTVRKRESGLDVVNEAIGEIAGRDMTTHQMFAYPMVAVATICPLFGLLGTVLGIIETFEMIAMAGAMGDPAIMASGISKALVCTAFGLVVAIPMLFIYHIIKLRTQYLNRLLEEDASFLISDWFMKGKEIRA